MRETIAGLWGGRMPLSRAFWQYAVCYGTALNLLFTVGTFAVLAAGGSGALALTVHMLPLPYTIFVVIAVFRSAARYRGPAYWAQLAKIGVIVWAAIATVI